MYQKIKIADGTTDGTATAAVGGGVEAAALRVTIASDSTGVVSIDDNGGTITVDGTVAVTNAGITTIAGAVAGTEMQVDVLTMPVTHVIADSGTVTAVTSITNAVAVTNAGITTIAGAVAGTEMQVDVLTVPAPLSVVGGGTEAAAMRVTIANDSTGVLSVDDNGGAITVDGALTSVATITNVVHVDDNSASLTVDVGTALPAGTALIGKVGIDQATANANEVVIKSGTVTTVSTVTAVTSITNPVTTIVTATSVDVVPTLTVHATYVSGDYVGESGVAMTFAGCARGAAGTGKVTGAVLIDYALQSVAGELWLFDTAPTPPNDSAAWTITDANAARCIGVIPFALYYASALNSVAPVSNLSIPYKCAATSLFGCFVTRGAPAYASGDLTFRLFIDQD
jgi:hypothetical protein